MTKMTGLPELINFLLINYSVSRFIISTLAPEHFNKLLLFVYNMVLAAICITTKLYYTTFALAEVDLCRTLRWCELTEFEVPIESLSCGDFSRNIRYDSIWNIPALSESYCRSTEGLRARPGWELWGGHPLLPTCCQVLSAHCKTCVTTAGNKMHLMSHNETFQESVQECESLSLPDGPIRNLQVKLLNY